MTQSSAAVANSQLAQITLGKTELVAPADTIVQKRDIEPGDTAQPGSAAFMLISAGVPDVLVAVPERVLDEISVGTPARVTAGSRTFTGSVSRLEPAADDLSRTVQVRIRVAHLPLVAGSVVEVALDVHRQTGLSLPLGAVMTDADGHASVELYQPAAKTVSIASAHVLGNAGDRVTVSGIRMVIWWSRRASTKCIRAIESTWSEDLVMTDSEKPAPVALISGAASGIGVAIGDRSG